MWDNSCWNKPRNVSLVKVFKILNPKHQKFVFFLFKQAERVRLLNQNVSENKQLPNICPFLFCFSLVGCWGPPAVCGGGPFLFSHNVKYQLFGSQSVSSLGPPRKLQTETVSHLVQMVQHLKAGGKWDIGSGGHKSPRPQIRY